MRRADRLFQIVQLLRSTRAITAKELALKLEVSERTIYRDMQDLSLSGVPVLGETGTGYKLLPGFELPPLMFSEDELGALLLGARMVKAWADTELSDAAEQALTKIESVLPLRLRSEFSRLEMMVPPSGQGSEVAENIKVVRIAIRRSNKLEMAYVREDGEASKRVVRPLGMAFWGKVWTLVAWCELRDGFRNFRLDRMRKLSLRPERFDHEAGKTLQDFFLTCPENERPEENPQGVYL